MWQVEIYTIKVPFVVSYYSLTQKYYFSTLGNIETVSYHLIYSYDWATSAWNCDILAIAAYNMVNEYPN